MVLLIGKMMMNQWILRHHIFRQSRSAKTYGNSWEMDSHHLVIFPLTPNSRHAIGIFDRLGKSAAFMGIPDWIALTKTARFILSSHHLHQLWVSMGLIIFREFHRMVPVMWTLALKLHKNEFVIFAQNNTIQPLQSWRFWVRRPIPAWESPFP